VTNGTVSTRWLVTAGSICRGSWVVDRYSPGFIISHQRGTSGDRPARGIGGTAKRENLAERTRLDHLELAHRRLRFLTQ
jgi:hypothetical protein